MKQTYKQKFEKFIKGVIEELSNNCLAASQYGYPRPGCLKLPEPIFGKVVAVMTGCAVVLENNKISFVMASEYRSTFTTDEIVDLADAVEKLRQTTSPQIYDPFRLAFDKEVAREELKRLKIID